MEKDYYFILGISPDATAEEIKKAYRINAIKYHPDKNFNDEYKTQIFLDIKEAYEILIDEDKRIEFDLKYKQNFESNKNSDDVNKYDKKEKAEFRYKHQEPFYSNQDRELHDTPQVPPSRDPWGETWSENIIFFRLPNRIGRIISGFSDYTINTKPKGRDLVKKVFKEDLGCSTLLAFLISGIYFYYSDNIKISITIFCILFIILLSRMFYIASGKGAKEFVNYYIGINGFAFYKIHNKQYVSDVEINFNDITDLAIRVEKRSLNFKYATTAYQFTWFDNKTNKILYDFSTVRDDKQNNLISKYTEHGFWLNKESEKYWTLYLLDNMESNLQKTGYIEFKVFYWQKSYCESYIRLGIGYIMFLQGKEIVTYNFDDIKKMYVRDANLFIEHKNFKKDYMFFKTGNKNSIPLNSLTNRLYFLKATELLLGYSLE